MNTPIKVTASFVTSLARPGPFPGQGLPEVAMVGRSNVGKSSLINGLTGSRLARTSSEPGRTRLINVFLLNDQVHLIDLPGYGFARVSRDEKARWAAMIESYLTGAQHLKLAAMLVDVRHAPTGDDVAMAGYLRHYNIPFFVAATKADKLSRAAVSRSVPVICRALAVQPWDVVPFSSTTLAGRDQVLSRVLAVAGDA